MFSEIFVCQAAVKRGGMWMCPARPRGISTEVRGRLYLVGAKVGPSSIAEGELGLLATRRLEKIEVCSIYTGEIFRTGTAQPPETVPDELSRHTAAGGTQQLDGSDDESDNDFDSVAARCNFDWPAASNEPKRGTRATHFVRYEEIQLGKAAVRR